MEASGVRRWLVALERSEVGGGLTGPPIESTTSW
jgi:hypothetical protein